MPGFTWRHRAITHASFAPDDLLEEAYHLVDSDAGASTDVVHPSHNNLSARSGCGHVGVDDVIDEREITSLPAVTVDNDLLICQQSSNEPVERHVRALARAVDGEVAEADRRHSSLGVQQTKMLAGQLG